MDLVLNGIDAKCSLCLCTSLYFPLYLNLTSLSFHQYFNKKAQLSLTNPRDAWNPGHGSLWLTQASRASKVTPFDSLPMVSYYRPIVTLCVKCTVMEISRHTGLYWSKIAEKSTPLSFDVPVQRTPANIRTNLMLLETSIFGLHFCRW